MSLEEREDTELLEASEDEATATPDTPSFWGLLRRIVFPSRVDKAARLNDLTEAIARHPDAAVNYLLRGEAFLEAGRTQLAKADFEQALQLAQSEQERDDWGITAQSIAGRAQRHLEKL